jgi:hypothetical protein
MYKGEAWTGKELEHYLSWLLSLFGKNSNLKGVAKNAISQMIFTFSKQLLEF